MCIRDSSEVDLAFAVHQGDIDKLVIESRVATSASIDERTDRVEEIERSVDQAIEDLEVARQAASFGQLDWSACSSS